MDLHNFYNIAVVISAFSGLLFWIASFYLDVALKRPTDLVWVPMSKLFGLISSFSFSLFVVILLAKSLQQESSGATVLIFTVMMVAAFYMTYRCHRAFRKSADAQATEDYALRSTLEKATAGPADATEN